MKPINMSLLQGQMAKKGLDWKGQIQYLDWDDDNIRLSQCKLRDREWQPKLKHQYIVLETKNWRKRLEDDQGYIHYGISIPNYPTSRSSSWTGSGNSIDRDDNMITHEFSNEKVLTIRLYKCKLWEWQITQFYLNHQFVVLETENWWWAIEKDGEGIVLQRSKRLEDVEGHRTDGTPRPEPLMQMHFHDVREKDLTMTRILDYVAFTKLHLPYHFLFANCKRFAAELYNAIIKY
ncbi:uncharacterized protein LOC116294279 isoform X2 [Actinia tenebrosa]|uniref:Uncharacterized protein LOC116294279 isoform X2 n=1 Tax=Actinia tenebrosa TaxID=6105 RepID=A0A6P8HQ47_ACTTE|nr:uncharacterized protein LOC116294279 isoform X2 [Actinia tenebrosa]